MESERWKTESRKRKLMTHLSFNRSPLSKPDSPQSHRGHREGLLMNQSRECDWLITLVLRAEIFLLGALSAPGKNFPLGVLSASVVRNVS
jgi:hypothetical protein